MDIYGRVVKKVIYISGKVVVVVVKKQNVEIQPSSSLRLRT
jgi:hypothetical protein